VTRHRLDHIGHHQYPGFEDDVLPLESLRIARAVEPLMVLQHRLATGQENSSSSGCRIRFWHAS